LQALHSPLRSRLNRVRYRIRNYRRVSQVSILALLIAAPFTHLFRFDLPTTSLYLFGMRLWVQHVFYFSLLMTAVIYLIIAASFLFGRVFCGWVCPQNLFNELARAWDARFGRTGAIAVSWVVSTFGGFVVWSYFTDGIALLKRYAAGEVPVGPTVAILAFGLFFTAAMAWWRTDVCKVACPYGHLQAIISNKNTMHLELFNLPQNRDICASCGLCAETCHIDVDPRTMEQKHCVTCGDCLDACQLVSDARKVPRVLNFVLGPDGEQVQVGKQGPTVGLGFKRMLPRLFLPAALALLLTGASAYGLAARSLVDVVVAKDHRSVMAVGGATSGGSVMRVSLMNLASVTETFTLSQAGLPEGWGRFESTEVTLAPGAKADIALRVTPTEFKKGLYKFTVTVQGAQTGETDTFDSVYVVGN
jgi:polyferredoxin